MRYDGDEDMLMAAVFLIAIAWLFIGCGSVDTTRVLVTDASSIDVVADAAPSDVGASLDAAPSDVGASLDAVSETRDCPPVCRQATTCCLCRGAGGIDGCCINLGATAECCGDPC